MTTLYLGEFEQVVLLAVLRLGESAYAIPIREEIAALVAFINQGGNEVGGGR